MGWIAARVAGKQGPDQPTIDRLKENYFKKFGRVMNLTDKEVWDIYTKWAVEKPVNEAELYKRLNENNPD